MAKYGTPKTSRFVSDRLTAGQQVVNNAQQKANRRILGKANVDEGIATLGYDIEQGADVKKAKARYNIVKGTPNRAYPKSVNYRQY